MAQINEGGLRQSILVVDDTPANLKVLTSILKQNGYNARAVPNGKLALQAIKVEPPDLILLDINMPDLNGYEVCETLKKDELFKKIPVIFISALTETMDKVKALSIGGVDYITKPFQFEEVIARVETHLELYHLRMELEKYNNKLHELVNEQLKEIYDSQMATILAMAKITEVRDDNTGKHLGRVQAICRLLAEKLTEQPKCGMLIDKDFIENIFYASPLHDIGKVGIPDNILLKPGKLTSEEFEVMKTHTTIGAETLEVVTKRYPKNKFIKMGLDIARSHHEKWDGSGYLDGLAGDKIPLSARIMALADVYDALLSKRPYKEAFTREITRDIIVQGSGSHFDPMVVEAFLAIEQDLNIL